MGDSDPRIVIYPGFPAHIVEVERWDGSDFFGWTTGGIVTKRALNFFASRHVGPIIAKPLRANINGASAAKMAFLEDAKALSK